MGYLAPIVEQKILFIKSGKHTCNLTGLYTDWLMFLHFICRFINYLQLMQVAILTFRSNNPCFSRISNKLTLIKCQFYPGLYQFHLECPDFDMLLENCNFLTETLDA